MSWLATIPQSLRRVDAVSAPTDLPIMDEPTFAAFHARTARPLLAYLTRAGGNRALAEDLSQEAYLRFLRACRSEAGEVACRSFLFRIASNLLRDHWRRPALASMEEIATERAPLAPDAWGASEAVLELAPAWARLGLRERQVLWLAYVEGYSHRELAGMVGLNAAGVRVLLFRARRKMHNALTEKKR